MEWLKDKKNQPIVAAISAVVLILVVVLILFETGVIGGSEQTPPVTVAQGGYPGAMPGAPGGGMPGYPGGGMAGYPGGGMAGAPGQMGAVAGGVPGALTGKLSAGKPPADVTKGLDPFNVVLKPGQNIPKPVRIAANTIVPFDEIVKLKPTTNEGPQGPLPVGRVPNILIKPRESATMRVSGVVQTSTGVHAVLEASGQSQAVQPGDSVAGGKVVSIQSDGLMLRGDDGTLVHVPLGSFPTANGGGYPSGGGYPPMGGYPGGGYPPPGGGYPGGYPPPGGGFPGAPASNGNGVGMAN